MTITTKWEKTQTPQGICYTSSQQDAPEIRILKDSIIMFRGGKASEIWKNFNDAIGKKSSPTQALCEFLLIEKYLHFNDEKGEVVLIIPKPGLPDEENLFKKLEIADRTHLMEKVATIARLIFKIAEEADPLLSEIREEVYRSIGAITVPDAMLDLVNCSANAHVETACFAVSSGSLSAENPPLNEQKEADGFVFVEEEVIDPLFQSYTLV